MEKIWKVKNTEKLKTPIKTTIRIENTKTIAVYIEPGEFVLCMPYLTAQLEAQSIKRGFLDIEEDYDNSYLNLELGKIYKEDNVEEIKNNLK